VPVIGNILRKTVVARFTRTMGTLLSSGVPILDSMEIVAKTSGNVVVKEAIMHAREKVSEGKDVAGPLAETKVFPPMVVQMIAVGEQTGAMDTMLQKIADFYEDEVDAAVNSMTALIEPFMLVFLGGVVGGLLIAMYMPIFEIAGNVKTK
jgi:type IV pilus assembly protein PilC